MAYTKIVFQNSPSTATPLNAENLNHMDDQIALNDQRLTEIETNGVVNTFNGRTGAVTPTDGDYTADMIPYDEENSVGDILGNATSEIDGITVANVSGESFALVPTSEGNALATHIYGMSTQNGTPTPSSPVDIVSSKADFRCVGNNLIPYPYYKSDDSEQPTTGTNDGITWKINSDRSVTLTGEATANFSFYFAVRSRKKSQIPLKAGTYILSGCPNGGSNSTYYMYLNAYKAGTTTAQEGIKDLGESASKSYTDDIVAGVYIYIVNGYQIVDSLTFKPMLRLADVTDDTYEPYKHTDITTDLTLRAIEVTSSDNYNLVRDGKYYIADTVDWDEDEGYVLTRRVAHREFDGTETGWAKSSATTADTFQISDNEAYQSAASTGSYLVKCLQSNRFAPDTNAGDISVGECRVENSLLRFAYTAYNTTSLENWKTYLGSNPLIIDFIKVTPTTEPLTSEQAQSLLSLKTYDVSTSINAQASPEPTVELEYAKSQTTALALSGHNVSRINALKIVDLNTALIELGGK